jgi:hypothetical protein
MVERDRANRVKSTQVVFIGSVIAMPGDDVERRVVDLARPQIAAEFRDLLHGSLTVLKPGDGGLEIARVRKAVGSDGAQVGKAKLLAVVLANIAARDGFLRVAYFACGIRRSFSRPVRREISTHAG